MQENERAAFGCPLLFASEAFSKMESVRYNGNMCFSATASLVAGGTLAAVGGLTLSRAKTRKELPLASVPLLFGIQQITDGIVWLSFGMHPLNDIAIYAYALFSRVFWPIFLPFSILLLETDRARKNVLRLFSLLGLSVGLFFSYFILVGPISAQIVNHCIVYTAPHPYALTMLTLYLAATYGACLFSSHKAIRIFGWALLASFIISGWFYFETFSSVWCFFAAVLSAIIYWHFHSRFANRKKI